MISKRAASVLSCPDVPSALRAVVMYAAQNPGLDYRDYSSGYNDKHGRSAYFWDARRITADYNKVAKAVRSCELFHVTDDDVIQACRQAFSGRLTVTKLADGKYGIDYCTGQYWPTEYRAACAAVLDRASNLAYQRMVDDTRKAA